MKRYIKSADTTEYEAGGETFDGYMGAVGWKGKNYDFHRDVKDIAKIVRSQFKKKFPGYKISVRISRFSGGQAIDATVWMHTSDLMPKEEFVETAASNPWEFYRPHAWVSYKTPDGKRKTELAETFFYDKQPEELREFFSNVYDDTIAEYSGGSATYPTLNYTGSAYGGIPLVNDAPLKYVKGLLDSFNYDDSNSMVDYFSVNFYSDIEYKYD